MNFPSFSFAQGLQNRKGAKVCSLELQNFMTAVFEEHVKNLYCYDLRNFSSYLLESKMKLLI